MTTNMEKTMSENMTIESFFLADYQRLKKENDELKATIQKNDMEKVARASDFGFSDLRKKTRAVRCEVTSSYYAFDNETTWGKFDAEQLAALAEKEDEALLEEAKKTRRKWGGNVYEEKNHTFPFTVRFSSYKECSTYAYDPDKSKTDLFDVKEEADTDCWVNARLENECRALAAGSIRDMILDRIEELKIKEQQCEQ